jgi:hypothetical protein
MKRILLLVPVVLVLVVSGGQEMARAQNRGDGVSRVQQGLAIAPLPLNLQGRNVALVALGSYIVNAQADCNGCHTVNFDPYLPGGNPFFGEPEMIDPAKYLVGGSPFGPFVTRNLRLDPVSGLPSDLTFEEFLLVLRTGIDLHDAVHPIPGTPVLQAMPWPVFRNMTDHDIRAIYEYLSALPPEA